MFRLNQSQTKNNVGAENHSSIYICSFALEPEKLQPTGTCNFSRIKNIVLSMELEPHYTKLYKYNFRNNWKRYYYICSKL